MNCREIAVRLTKSLGLAQSPVAISFSDSPDLTRPAARAPAGCRFWQDGAVRTFATTAEDHGSCAIGMYTHNLEQTPAQQRDLSDALAIFRELGYVRDADLPLIPVLNTRPRSVVYGPLAESAIAPAIVLLFVNGEQALVAVEAVQQIENRFAAAMGRPACAVVPMVVNMGEAAVSFGCCGARAYLDTFPGTTIFAIPGPKLEQYTERIETLASANATLRTFHQVRRGQITAGLTPTVAESLSALKTG